VAWAEVWAGITLLRFDFSFNFAGKWLSAGLTAILPIGFQASVSWPHTHFLYPDWGIINLGSPAFGIPAESGGEMRFWF
jgi:hypothetical protein